MTRRQREGNLAARKARAVAAVMSSKSAGEAARRAGVGRRTLYRWRRSDPAFRATLEDARRELVRRAVAEAMSRIGGALGTLSEIARDESAPPGVRARSSLALLRFALGEDGAAGPGRSEYGDPDED